MIRIVRPNFQTDDSHLERFRALRKETLGPYPMTSFGIRDVESWDPPTTVFYCSTSTDVLCPEMLYTLVMCFGS